MNASRLWTIYVKELVDTLRDHKTLLFMLLIPTLATPALIIGSSWLVEQMFKRQEAKEVVVAATDQSRAAYIKHVHQWFLRTHLANTLRIAAAKPFAQTPFTKALMRPEQLETLREALDGKLGEKPADILNDPEAFYRWTRNVAGGVRAGLDSFRDRNETPAIKLPDDLQQQLIDFYVVAIKGLGLVKFVDPADPKWMPEAPESFVPLKAPAGLKDEKLARRLAYAIKRKTVQTYFEAPPELATVGKKSEGRVEITVLYDSTINLSRKSFDRFEKAIEALGKQVLIQRLEFRGLNVDFIEPLGMKAGTDFSDMARMLLALIGGIIPAIIIVYAFMGGMYPAIDLGAGEKERNTLETLLLTPASRTEIALGKFLVILTTSLISALLGVTAVALSCYYALPAEITGLLAKQIQSGTIGLVVLLTIPPAAAFSGILLAISIFARSFKEAQNYMAPLQLLVIMPALAGMLPNVEMDARLAMMPLLNVTLLARESLKGDFNLLYFCLTMLSTTILAAVCVAYAVRQFNREEVLFRS